MSRWGPASSGALSGSWASYLAQADRALDNGTRTALAAANVTLASTSTYERTYAEELDLYAEVCGSEAGCTNDCPCSGGVNQEGTVYIVCGGCTYFLQRDYGPGTVCGSS